jgi:hypothetical protein
LEPNHKVTTSAVGLRKEMDTMLIDVITMIVDAYRGTVPLILNHVIMTDKLAITGDINITTFINTLSDFYLPTITGNKLIECQNENLPHVPANASIDVIDWSDTKKYPLAKTVGKISHFINNALGFHGTFNLNELIAGIDTISSMKPGSFKIQKEIGPLKFDFPRAGKIALDIHDIEIDGLNSIYNIGLLVPNATEANPRSGAILNNKIEFAHTPTSACEASYGKTHPFSSCGPLNFSFHTRLSFAGEYYNEHHAFQDDVTITISISNLSLSTQLNVSLDHNILSNLTLSAMLRDKAWKATHSKEMEEWGRSNCGGNAIVGLNVVGASPEAGPTALPPNGGPYPAYPGHSKWRDENNHLDFGMLGVTISDVGVSPDGTAKGSRLDEINPRIKMLEGALTDFMNRMLDYFGPRLAPPLMDSLLQKYINKSQNCSGDKPPPPTPAPKPPKPPPHDISFWSHGKIGTDATFATGFSLCFLLFLLGWRSRKTYVSRAGDDMSEGLLADDKAQQFLGGSNKRSGVAGKVRRVGDDNEADIDSEASGSFREGFVDSKDGRLSASQTPDFTADGQWIRMADDAPSWAWPCLLFDKGLNRNLRYGVVFMLIFCVCLFVTGNTSVGASVIIKIWFEGEEIMLPPVFSFTLANSVKDMYNAKVYVLSFLIAIFSGAWPYAKLLLMLTSMMTPPFWLPVRKRETLMIWLDALGKWSMIDAYILIMMMVAFNLNLNLWEEVSYQPSPPPPPPRPPGPPPAPPPPGRAGLRVRCMTIWPDLAWFTCCALAPSRLHYRHPPT